MAGFAGAASCREAATTRLVGAVAAHTGGAAAQGVRTWRCPRRGGAGAPPRREREVEREKEREREGRRGRGRGRGASGGGGVPREERERDEREGRPDVGGSLFFARRGCINLFGVNWGDIACW